jgi:hypothetical protein
MEEGYVWNQLFCPGFAQEALILYQQLLAVCVMPSDYFFGCPSVLCRTHSRTGCQRNILREEGYLKSRSFEAYRYRFGTLQAFLQL